MCRRKPIRKALTSVKTDRTSDVKGDASASPFLFVGGQSLNDRGAALLWSAQIPRENLPTRPLLFPAVAAEIREIRHP